MPRKPMPECHAVPRPAAKNRASRLPKPTVLRIEGRYLAGENQTQIAKAEKCDRETVSRIVKSAEMAEYIERKKEEYRGLVPDALSAIRYALQVQKDARIAFEILRNVGVAPPEGQPEQLPPTQTQESPEERQARLVASVFLANHHALGIELPDDVQQALDLDEAAHPEEKGVEKTTKQLRR